MPYGVRQAYLNYQHAVLLLAKVGLTASTVWQMAHLEVQSWIDVYLAQQGVKTSLGKIQFDPQTVIISQRKGVSKTE